MSCAGVLAVRYRPGVSTQTTHPVHLVPPLAHSSAGAVGAYCGMLLRLQKLETVEPDQDMLCPRCVQQHAATTQAPEEETAYCKLGWPVHLLGDQVVLPLGDRAAAQIVPVELVKAITPILTALDRPVSVLLHPDAPGCGVVIAGEPYGVPLPWPEAVQMVTGMLALPPSQTPHGPVRWYHQAPNDPLASCREIDVFAAMRTAGQAMHGQSGTQTAR